MNTVNGNGIHAFRIEERALVRCEEKKRACSEEMMAGKIIRMCRIFNFRREWIQERMVWFELTIRLNGQRQTWRNIERKNDLKYVVCIHK